MEKATNVLENGSSKETEFNESSQRAPEDTIFQDEEIEQIVALDQMDEEYLQQYVIEHFELENVKEDDIQNMEIQ